MKNMVKKKIVTQETQEAIRVLAAVPACHISHVQYRKQITDAIKANFNVPNVEVTLSVCEDADDRVDVDGWQVWEAVVEKYNVVVNRVLAEGFDYLWIVESDVVVPQDALAKLLGVDADVASAVTPFHFENYLPYPVFKGMVTCGFLFVTPSNSWDILPLHLEDVKDKLMVGSVEKPIFNGTSCVLIKRSVFESGLRFRFAKAVASFDLFFWYDVQKAGFSAVTDGFVVCEHLGV
jgi:hypothetical protein